MKIVKFGASWCEPCKSFAPALSAFKEQSEYDIEELDIDVPENKELLRLSGAKTIPTVAVMNDDGTTIATLSDSTATQYDLETFVANAINMKEG